MDDEKLEKAFQEAQERWNKKESAGINEDYQTRKERYFFFVGKWVWLRCGQGDTQRVVQAREGKGSWATINQRR